MCVNEALRSLSPPQSRQLSLQPPSVSAIAPCVPGPPPVHRTPPTAPLMLRRRARARRALQIWKRKGYHHRRASVSAMPRPAVCHAPDDRPGGILRHLDAAQSASRALTAARGATFNSSLRTAAGSCDRRTRAVRIFYAPGRAHCTHNCTQSHSGAFALLWRA